MENRPECSKIHSQSPDFSATSRKNSAFWAIIAALCFVTASSSRAATATPTLTQTEAPVILRPLFEVLGQKLAQISFEKQKSPAEESFLKQAKAFEKIKRSERSTCQASMSDFPLCMLLGQPKKASVTLESRHSSADIQRWENQIEKADLAAIQEMSVSALNKAFRLMPDWASVRPAIEAVVAHKKCLSSGTYVLFGMKAEEFLPDPTAKTAALALHEKASQCGNDEYADRARFRRALFLINDNQCGEAEPSLVRLSENPDGEFSTRALYWRYYCAHAAGNEPLAGLLKRRMYQDFPLAFHSLIASQGKGPDLLVNLSTVEPMVQFRSSTVPLVNPWLERIEWLEQAKRKDLAMDILRAISGDLDRAELPVQLYEAVLFERLGDQIGKFKALSGIFKVDPNWITQSTLQLFYPVKRWDELQKHKKKVDPYLAAALIRQESGFNEFARSPVGAMGLMQLMFDTARRMERVSRREVMDARTNIRLGVKYFSSLLDRYQGDIELALAAYNAGPERVDDWKKRYVMSQKMLFLDLIPFRETRDYVALITRNYYWYVRLYGGHKSDASEGVRAPAAQTIRSKVGWNSNSILWKPSETRKN